MLTDDINPLTPPRPSSIKRDSPKNSYGSGHLGSLLASGSRTGIGREDRQRSVTFLPETASPKRSGESSYGMAASYSPGGSPHGGLRSRLERDTEEIGESSADENTAIVKKGNAPAKSGYGATANGVDHAHTFEHVEEILGARLYIHDCLVTVMDALHRRHGFRIFFTRHIFQPSNRSLQSVDDNVAWHGEMLIMRVNKDNSHCVTRLRRGDGQLAKEAASRWVVLV